MAITRGVGPAYGTVAHGFSFDITLNSTTAGRSLVFIIDWQETGAVADISSITISGESNATVIAGSKANVSSNHKQIAFLANNTAGGNKTITVTFSQDSYATGSAMEYTGLDTTTQPDASNSGSGSNTAASVTLTTVAANVLIVAGNTGTSVDPTAGSGYTLWGTRPNNALFDEDEDNVNAGAAGSKTVDFATTNGSGAWWVSAASFKPTGGSTTPLTFTGTDSLAGGELL